MQEQQNVWCVGSAIRVLTHLTLALNAIPKVNLSKLTYGEASRMVQHKGIGTKPALTVTMGESRILTGVQ